MRHEDLQPPPKGFPMTHTIFIRGIPESPSITSVRVRETPGLNANTLFRADVGLTATAVEIRLDPTGDSFQGQTYRWFLLAFPDGRRGWVRDDLLDLQGDLRALGYSMYPLRAYAFAAAKNLPPPSSVSPAPPAPPASPPPAAPPISPPPSPPPPTVNECIGTVRREIRARVRSRPSLASEHVAFLEPGARVRISAVEAGQDGLPFRWAKVSAVGLEGYVREDLLTYSDGCTALGLSPAPSPPPPSTNPVGGGSPVERFSTPLRGSYTVFQEFNVNRHKGIDLSGPEGIAVVAGGSATVHEVVVCTRCRPDAPNFRSQGLPDWDSNAIRDPAWGFGFGNYVMLRYAWADLPNMTRQTLQGQGLAGAFIYAIYAHLSRIDVAQGTAVSAGTQIGLSGNTGNSTGPHLHLELRVSFDAEERSIFNRIVINPRSMFVF